MRYVELPLVSAMLMPAATKHVRPVSCGDPVPSPGIAGLSQASVDGPSPSVPCPLDKNSVKSMYLSGGWAGRSIMET